MPNANIFYFEYKKNRKEKALKGKVEWYAACK